MSNDSLDLDLLTADFSDLPVAAAYRIPPTGAYSLKVTATLGKSAAGNAMITAAYEVLEVIAVTDPDEANQVIVEDKFSSYFTWNNEWGMKGLQAFLVPYVAHFQTGKINELVVSESNPNGLIKELTIVATLKRRPRKEKGAIVDGEYNFDFKDVNIA